MVSLLAVALIALGGYSFYLKNAAPAAGEGQIVTQAISTTGVEMDLNAIAQAERMYFAQNGSYASLDQLVSGGTMNISAGGRDGYTYSVETSPTRLRGHRHPPGHSRRRHRRFRGHSLSRTSPSTRACRFAGSTEPQSQRWAEGAKIARACFPTSSA